jgi:hypothetical protein
MMPAVTFDRHSLHVNGQPVVIRSGAMHYFRLPDEKTWSNRLAKLKAAGYNTVDLYFNWSYHCAREGVFDFTGARNIQRLLELTQQHGLWVIARPGPYINAELAAGGLPLWLLNKPGVRLRHRNAAGGYEFCPQYGAAVTDWITHIVPFIAKAPNVIACQIENEYATSEMDPAPIRDLAKLTRDLGVTVPLFHNDLYAAGLYADELDLYAFDHYPVTDFAQDWRQHAEHVFSLIDNVEVQIRPYCPERPMFVAECQAGWFSGWSSPEEFEMETFFGREFLPLMTKTLLAQGVTMFNHYLAVGCTNWGSLGAIDSHSSYDFSAPISESGELHESLYEAKAINQMLGSFDLSRTDRMETPVVEQAPNLPYWMATRKSLAGGYWVFYRNLTALPEQFMVRPLPNWPEVSITLASQEAVILPLQIPLKATGWNMLWSATECVLQTDKIVVIKADQDATVMLRGPLPEPLPEVDRVTLTRFDDGLSTDDAASGGVTEGGLILYCPALCEAEEEMVKVRLGSLVVILASQRLIDTMWQQDLSQQDLSQQNLSDHTHQHTQQKGALVFGPVAQLSDTEFTILDPEEDILLLSPMGQIARECGFTDIMPPHLPLLNQMKLSHGAPQLVDASLLEKPLTVSATAYKDGWRWYGMPLLPIAGELPTQLTIQARHHWVVFINQTCVAQHFDVDDLLADPAVVNVSIPERFASEKQLDVMILTDSLGVSKGFHDDPRHHEQGLLRFDVDGQSVLSALKVSEGLSRWQPTLKRLFGLMPESSPVIFAETTFSLDDFSSFDAAFALEIDLDEAKMPVQRIDIHLNGERIGRYRGYQNNQTRFLLPAGILKTQSLGINHLELVFIQPEPILTFDQVQLICQQDIHVVLACAFQKITL